MGAEWDIILHHRVGELEKIMDELVALMPCLLLFPHGELGWYLAFRFLVVAISHKNNRVSRRNFAPYRLYIKSGG